MERIRADCCVVALAYAFYAFYALGAYSSSNSPGRKVGTFRYNDVTVLMLDHKRKIKKEKKAKNLEVGSRFHKLCFVAVINVPNA